MPKRETSSPDVQRLLKTVMDHFDSEDRSVREMQLRQWKKLKCYWDSLFRVYWSSTAHDWRVYDQDNVSGDNGNGQDYAYDKPINVFRAYLESIIAALSQQIPGIKCYPDDADNVLDVETARAGDAIAKILYRHNDVSLLWLHALFIYCTEGLIASYTYTKEDEKYGTYEKQGFGEELEDVSITVCSICGTPTDEEVSHLEQDEFDPSDEDIFAQNILAEGGTFCPNCLMQVDPEVRTEKVLVPRLTGITNAPKTRQCMEVYGGLFVKVANYATKQEDTPYLIFSYETHWSNVIERYEHLADKFDPDGNYTGSSSNDFYERWARLSTQYRGEEPRNTITCRNAWLRPCAFNILPKDDADKLKKLFPNGAKVVFINDSWAEDCNQSLDDHWTLSKNPLSDYLHHQPLGQLLTSVQEITNDIISLTLQTIEHGIPQTFYEQSILDGQVYSEMEVAPGMLIPVKAPAGKSVNDSFHEVKTASLSGEVLPFGNKIQELGQLTSGAQPSIFGGEIEGSKTAAEYSMSRAQSLQRLQIAWKMLSMWWKNVMGKSITGFIKDVAHDERIVEKDKSGNFINVFVRRAQLNGKIGNIELEAAETLPVTYGQNKDVIMQMMQSQHPSVMEALTDPENFPLIADAVGIPEFKIPGEDDRIVQWEEIKALLESEPIVGENPETLQPEEQSSVPIEPTLDNNIIHADICRRFLISPAGRLAKVENNAGYKNVLLHMQMHVHVIQAMQAMNAAPQPGQENDTKAANTEKKVEANG